MAAANNKLQQSLLDARPEVVLRNNLKNLLDSASTGEGRELVQKTVQLLVDQPTVGRRKVH